MHEIILFFVGIVVGAMNSVAGGGMLIGFPIMLGVGMPPLIATATTNLVVLPGQLASAYGYRQYLHKLSLKYLLLLIPCMFGAAVGATILRHTSSTRFAHLAPLLILFAVILFSIQPFLHFHLHRHISQRSKNNQVLVLIGLALIPVAIYAGYFGPGFGFIMLAFLGFTSLRDVHKMNGLKNLAGASIAIAAIICLLSAHLFNWSLGLSMAAGCTIGGYSGSRVSLRFSSHAIRVVVIAIGFISAAYLAFRAY
jgi:uncharacterized membrane protein YfcA